MFVKAVDFSGFGDRGPLCKQFLHVAENRGEQKHLKTRARHPENLGGTKIAVFGRRVGSLVFYPSSNVVPISSVEM